MLDKDYVHDIGNGKYVITSNLMNVQFWIGEYAKRRLFIENEDKYDRIIEVIRFLKDISNEILNLRPELFRKFIDASLFEFEILRRYGRYHSLSKILRNELYELIIQKYPNAENSLKEVYELSQKYGYVLSDLELPTKDDNIEGHFLIKLIEGNNHRFWKNYKSQLETDQGFTICEAVSIPRKFPSMDSYQNEYEHISVLEVDDKGNDLIICIKNTNSYDSQTELNKVLTEIEVVLLLERIGYIQSQRYQIKKEIFYSLCRDIGMESSIDTRRILPCVCMRSESLNDADIDYLQTLALGPFPVKIKEECNDFRKHKFICSNTVSSTPFFTNCCCIKLMTIILNNILTHIEIIPEDISNISSNIFPDSFLNNETIKTKIDNYMILTKAMKKQRKRPLNLNLVLEKGVMRSGGLTNRALGLVAWDARNIYKKKWKNIFKELHVATKNNKIINHCLPETDNAFNRKLQNKIYETTHTCITKGVFLPLP